MENDSIEMINYEDKLVKLYCGDCVEGMKGFDENLFDAIVTDPPYLISFMSKTWDTPNYHTSPKVNAKYPKSRNVRGVKLGTDYGASDSQGMQLWHYQWAVEALRVVKPGGYLLAFGGTRTFHRLACAIEDAGFEFRDTIMWVYSQGFPKSLNISKVLKKSIEEQLRIQGVTGEIEWK